MMTCEKLSEVDAHLRRVCGALGITVPIAVRSAEYDRIEISTTGDGKDCTTRLMSALSASLNSAGKKWDVWVDCSAGDTLCVAEASTNEDSE